MIKFDKVRVSVGGVDIDSTGFNITKGIGKGYNTASVQGKNILGSVGQEIDITINATRHNFIIFERTESNDGNTTLSCKGKPATLDDETATSTELNYTNSDDLIEGSIANIVPFVNNIPEINFNTQTYTKSSTKLSRIIDMVSVINGDVYENQGTLFLDTFKTIPENSIPNFFFSNVISFNYSDRVTKFNKVRSVLINPVTETIYSTPDIKFEYEDNRGEIVFNPSLSQGLPYDIQGLTVSGLTDIFRVENKQLSDETHYVTEGGIDEILYLFLDGTPFNDYVTYDGTNVIRFLTKQTGSLEVRYRTKGLTVNIDSTTDFSITYQCMRISENVELNSSSSSTSCSAELQNGAITYDRGGVIRTLSGTDLSLIFLDKKEATNVDVIPSIDLVGGGKLFIKQRYSTTPLDMTFANFTTSQLNNVSELSNGNISYLDDLGKYGTLLGRDITNLGSVYYGSTVVTGGILETFNDLVYLTLPDNTYEGFSLEISFNIDVVDVTIPPLGVGHQATLMDIISCNGIQTNEIVVSDEVLCSIPATFEIDVASSFNLPVSGVTGRTLSGDFGSLLVDPRGKVIVTVDEAKEYLITCYEIRPNAEIVVDGRGVSS